MSENKVLTRLTRNDMACSIYSRTSDIGGFLINQGTVTTPMVTYYLAALSADLETRRSFYFPHPFAKPLIEAYDVPKELAYVYSV